MFIGRRNSRNREGENMFGKVKEILERRKAILGMISSIIRRPLGLALTVALEY